MTSSQKAPPPPDYKALAEQQAGLNKEAFEYQTKANRVNQSGPAGSSSWTQGPDGTWSQTEQYNPEYQKILDAQRGNTQALTDQATGMLGGIKNAMGQPLDMSGMTDVQGWQGQQPIDKSGMQDWGQLDFNSLDPLAGAGFGSVQEIQKAMMSRLQPGLEQGNAAEQARLKAQGITEGSPAWQAAMQSQGQKMNDAQQQALLGSMGAYGDIFNRSLASRQQGVGEQTKSAEYANSLRNQQYGEGLQDFNTGNQAEMLSRGASEQDRTRQLQEALMQRQLPLSEYQALMGSAGGVPALSFNSFFNQGNAGAADLTGAAQQQYQAQLDNYNLAQKKKGGLMAGIGTAGGAIIGGMYGGPAGAAAGASAGGALGGGIGSAFG